MTRLPFAATSCALSAALLLAACATAPSPATAQPAAPPAAGGASTPVPDGAKRFSGAVQAIDNGCFSDGTCSVAVDGVVVVTMTGWSRDTWGHRDDELKVGGRVDVACRPTAEGCTLNGDAGYYIRRAPGSAGTTERTAP